MQCLECLACKCDASRVSIRAFGSLTCYARKCKRYECTERYSYGTHALHWWSYCFVSRQPELTELNHTCKQEGRAPTPGTGTMMKSLVGDMDTCLTYATAHATSLGCGFVDKIQVDCVSVDGSRIVRQYQTRVSRAGLHNRHLGTVHTHSGVGDQSEFVTLSAWFNSTPCLANFLFTGWQRQMPFSTSWVHNYPFTSKTSAYCLFITSGPRISYLGMQLHMHGMRMLTLAWGELASLRLEVSTALMTWPTCHWLPDLNLNTFHAILSREHGHGRNHSAIEDSIKSIMYSNFA